MGKYVAKQTIKLLSINKKKLSNSNVAILGFSFKDNIPDTRNTKVIQIVNHLQKQKIKVKLFDSIASKHEIKKKYKVDLYNFSNLKKFKYDAIILAVSHDKFKKLDLKVLLIKILEIKPLNSIHEINEIKIKEIIKMYE